MDKPPENSLDRFVAAPMFVVALAFLVFLAGGLQELRFGETILSGASPNWIGMLILYPFFVIELAAHRVAGNQYLRQNLWFCILPPLRLGARDHENARRIWLPWLDWVETDRKLVRRLERIFSGPMIAVALIVLPVLAVEYVWWKESAHNPYLAFFLAFATSIIWLAFTFELIIMVSVVERKLAYCLAHWIDVLIVLLPFVAFMRMFRLAQLVRLHQVSEVARVYRLRGTAMRAYRAVIALELIQRILHRNLEKRLAALEQQLEEMEDDRRQILEAIRQLREALETSESPSAASDGEAAIGR